MLQFIRSELRALGSFISRNLVPIIVLSTALLFISTRDYHPMSQYWVSSLIYYFLLPLLTIWIVLHRNPLDFGLRIGNWRTWLVHLGIGILISLPVLYIGSRFASLDAYYAFNGQNFLIYFLQTSAYMLGWEYLCRGYLLFGLKEKFGELSIFVQLIPFMLLHLGKPEIETISTIITGVLFGYMAYRGDSFWPSFILHVFINIMFRVMVNYL